MIVFFPTYACRTPHGWTARIAGMVAQPLLELCKTWTPAESAVVHQESIADLTTVLSAARHGD